MKRFSPAHNRAKAIIKACAASGTGIDFLPDAPTFRYTPAADKPLHDGPPSPRGSIACGRGNVLKLKTWHPSRLDMNPMYGIRRYYGRPGFDPMPLTDTTPEEGEAKAAWAGGNPEPLRQLLAERTRAAKAAKARVNANVVEACPELFERIAA